MNTRRDVLAIGLLAVFALPASARDGHPVVTGHVVFQGAGRVADGVTALFRGLGFDASLISSDVVRDRLFRDLGAASAAGFDPASPLGAVFVVDGEVLHRVPFLVAADRALVEQGIAPGVQVLTAGDRGGLVLGPTPEVAAAVAKYVTTSGLDHERSGATVSFRFVAAPFAARSLPWLESQAGILRGLARMASFLSRDTGELELAAGVLEDAHALLEPWEMVDGELFVSGGGVRLISRCVPRAGTEAARTLGQVAALPTPDPDERRGVALRAETSVAASSVERWVGLLAPADSVQLEHAGGRTRLTVPATDALLPAQPGDAANAVARLTVSLVELRGGAAGEAPVHAFARVEGGSLRVELEFPAAQLQVCVPRIEAK